MKRILALFLAAVMIMSLTCCKKNTPANEPAVTTAPTQGESAPAATATPTPEPTEAPTPTPEPDPAMMAEQDSTKQK